MLGTRVAEDGTGAAPQIHDRDYSDVARDLREVVGQLLAQHLNAAILDHLAEADSLCGALQAANPLSPVSGALDAALENSLPDRLSLIANYANGLRAANCDRVMWTLACTAKPSKARSVNCTRNYARHRRDELSRPPKC